MRSRPTRSDEALFIVALTAVLAGTGLLLGTTKALPFSDYLWPLFVMATGGILLFLAIVRDFSEYFLGGGCFFGLAGLILLGTRLGGRELGQSWPLLMSAAGLAWFALGFKRRLRIQASFAVPAALFLFLGFFFALFSFDVVGLSLGRFILTWWPTVLIAGGAALFAAYWAKNRKRRGRSRQAKP